MKIQPFVVRRYASLSGIICFLLPFVSVKECKTESVTVYRGYELILHDNGWLYLVPIVTALVILTASFIAKKLSRPLSGFSAAFACVFSGISFCVIAFYPELQFLFDEVLPRIGQVAGALGWGLIYASLAWTVFLMMRSSLKTVRSGKSSAVRILPWTIALFVCGVLMFSSSAVLIAHDGAGEWVPVFAAVSIFLSAPACAMLFFVREAIVSGFRWGKVVTVVFSLCSVSGAALLLWSFIHS